MEYEYANFAARSNYEKVDVSSFYIGQLGELARGLTDGFKDSHADIPWKQMVDMRNTLIHRYGTRNIRVIWDVIEKDIPVLNRNAGKSWLVSIPAQWMKSRLNWKRKWCSKERYETRNTADFGI